VNAKKLGRQLKRELVANPKRAGLLGLLVLVAAYFWLPLVWGWIPKDEPDTVATATAPPNSIAAMAPPPLVGDGGQTEQQQEGEWKPTYTWKELTNWMDNDPLTLPASLLPQQRDPFSAPRAEVAKTTEEEDKEARIADHSVTPKSLGMVLSSTIVGPKWRVAQIDGKTYEQGQNITMTKDGREISFKVTRVYPRSVMLERRKQQFELTISPATESGIIEMYSGNN
jgi:hypothetical protein